MEESRFSSELLSLQVPICERKEWENSFTIKTRNLDKLFFLGILSWYLPEGFGVLLRMDLKEKIRDFEDLQILNFVLESKASCHLFLIHTRRWHTRELFGNILEKKLFQNIKFICWPRFKSKKKPIYPVRRRGYKDKGSLGNAAFSPKFVNLNKEERELEEAIKLREDSFQFFIGFYG